MHSVYFLPLSFSNYTVAVRSDGQSGCLLGNYFPGTCCSFSEVHMNMCRESVEADNDLWSTGKTQL